MSRRDPPDDPALPLSRREFAAGSTALVALSACGTATRREPEVPRSQSTFDMERLVEDCIAANEEAEAQAAVKEVLARAMRDPHAVLSAIGEPTQAGLKVFHRSETLTMFSAAWTPGMTLLPHNHLMWALIGIYTGREDNILWRRLEGDARPLEAHTAQCLFEGDVAALPATAIHSVTNPLQRFTGGLHIYGGDFFATERSQWDPETLAEEPSDGATIRKMFDRANERLRKQGESSSCT